METKTTTTRNGPNAQTPNAANIAERIETLVMLATLSGFVGGFGNSPPRSCTENLRGVSLGAANKGFGSAERRARRRGSPASSSKRKGSLKNGNFDFSPR